MSLDLSVDEVLTTTRAVRKRLDLTRPVEREVIEECVKIALQAPSASNGQGYHFVIVTDPKIRAEIGKLYRKGGEDYFSRGPGALRPGDTRTDFSKIRESSTYLVQNIDKVPVHVIPCYRGRPEGLPYPSQAALWLSIIPAAWSFALAARARGLGTAVTTFHLQFEKEAAELLGIPYDKVMQAGLMPLAYTKGSKFRPAPRKETSSVIHWDRW
ncbi:MAG TPA: nitroreductase family protein [Nitrososphaerales archaeon]|nr:nitroreductase family protein [Nitrososphaerales archaeon]